MTSVSTESEYYKLPKSQIGKKILPQILVLSIVLPTSDIGSDLVLVTNLYRGFYVCTDKTETKRNVAGEAECENVELENFLICYRY